MTGPTADDEGYQSDTGPQENPTALHFENNQPVTAAIVRPEGIVHAHGWKIAHISRIFNVPRRRIGKAVKNTYFPPDDELKDYDCVGQDFKEKFPRIKLPTAKDQANSKVTKMGNPGAARVSRSTHKKRRGRIPGSADSAVNGASSTSSSSRVEKIDVWFNSSVGGSEVRGCNLVKPPKKTRFKPGKFGFSDKLNTEKTKATKLKWNATQTAPAAKSVLELARLPAPATIAAFLEGVGPSKHLALFEARGFKDVSILGIIARFDDHTLRDTLRRFLTENMEELEGVMSPTESELSLLQDRIRELV
ncbi:hypothetical protein DFH06DRAFT_1141592 [Mycena polygramma]|nr:hypothetical protein DFH06DRAFT_1141592 [Mycena polygramma]